MENFKNTKMMIRSATVEDVSNMVQLAELSMECPWYHRDFESVLSIPYYSRLVEEQGQLQGYSIVRAIAGEMELMNLCVHPHLRRRGVASRLMSDLNRLASRLTCDHLFLEVRASNQGAIAFYEACGFRYLSRRPGYYPRDNDALHHREDGLVFQKVL